MSTLEILVNDFLQLNDQVLHCKCHNLETLKETEALLNNKRDEIQACIDNNEILKKILLLRRTGFL